MAEFFAIGEIALHGVAGPLEVGAAKWPAAGEIGRLNKSTGGLCD
jgi:hypothetical protein